MDLSIIILIGSFLLLLALNVPISFAVGLASFFTLLLSIEYLPAATTLVQRMAGGLNSFSLLAIPFFILAGLLMGQGGIAKRLIDFARAIIGPLPGGLALVNVVSSTMFGAISGSAAAATSAIGSFMVPEMQKAGYPKAFSAAVTVTASTTGLLIPPSNILIIYSLASGGLSISALFVAGYVPGLMVALGLLCVCAIMAKLKGYPAGAPSSWRLICQTGLAAIPSLMLIVIIIGGILGGVVTATEAGALAVAYALLLSVGIYREVTMAELPSILLRAVETTSMVMFLIAASTAMSWVLSYANVPQYLTASLLALSDNPLVLLLLINLVLLLVGTFMDMTPAVLIFTPIFLPVAAELGIDPLQFGIMMILNLCIGLCTPPVGSVLFVGCGIAGISLEKIVRPLLPMYVAMIVVLVLVTIFPQLSTALPAFVGVD